MGLDNKIRVYRAQFDITQQQLAQKVDVTRQTISAMERNRYNPSLILAFKIAKVFDVKVDEVFRYDEED